jgi:hypothetical protein
VLLSIIRAMSTLMMEAVSTSETSVNFYDTTRRNIPEDSHLQKQISPSEVLAYQDFSSHQTYEVASTSDFR